VQNRDAKPRVPIDDVRQRDRQRAAVPRDAASLILLRRDGNAAQVLLGRRSMAARFMPGFYVFPGGRVGAEDRLQLEPEPRDGRDMDAVRIALMRAAIRETYEETGLLLGYPAPHDGDRPVRTALEVAYHAGGLRPAVDALKYVGRAITPRQSPVRFNTRFFSADGMLAHGALASNGELDDLGWRTLEACLSLPMADVTRFMLERAASPSAERDDVVYHYVRGVPRVRRMAAIGDRQRGR
jgi:8-oxo-dGTP pyrophosphatase MutT (NUDIX family)